MISFADGRCAGVFGDVYLEVILNFEIDNPIILFGMLRFN